MWCEIFDFFVHLVLRQGPISPTHHIGGEGLQTYVAWGVSLADVPSLVIRFCCSRRVACGSNIWLARAMCPSLFLLVWCMFQAPAVEEQSNEDDCHYVFLVYFLCCTGCFVSSYLSVVLTFVSLDKYQI
jgi:hypothetical protein